MFVYYYSPTGKLGEAEAVCAHALSIVEHNREAGAETPHLMAALLKLQSKILKRQGERVVFMSALRKNLITWT